jgi:uncharacterized protein (DUF433 family)
MPERNELPLSRYLGVGIYSIPDASRISGVSTSRIRRWARGYQYKVGNETRQSPAVWEADLPPIDGVFSLSFLDLLEVRFIDAFLDAGLGWKKLRLAADTAKELLGTTHPFSTQSFKTDGRTIFAEFVEETGERILLDLVRSQYAFNQVVSPSLYKGIEFSPNDAPIRWWPMGKRSQIVIDPLRAFGQPITSREGVPTKTLVEAVAAEGSIDRVSHWFAVKPSAIRAALKFEEQIGLKSAA